MTAKSSHFLNRELSWLAFNERVLAESESPDVPLLDRLKFLAIVSSNLDEFSMVRVGGLKHLVQRKDAKPCPAGLTPARQLQEVRRRVQAMVARQYRHFNTKVWPELTAAGLHHLRVGQLNQEQRNHLAALFEEQIYPLLTPVGIDEDRRVSVLPELTLNVLVRLRGGGGPRAAPKVAIVAVPPSLPRTIMVPADERSFVLIEDVVLLFLGRLFVGQEVLETALFRLTRDADLSVEERKDEEFLAAMADVLIQRRRSAVVRLELAAPVSAWARGFLKDLLEVGEDDVYTLDGPLDLKAWGALANLPGLSRFRDPEWQPQPAPGLPPEAGLWQTLRAHDVLLHHPYESFDAIVRLLEEAADDRNVLAIKQVLYRTSGQSKVIGALERAARGGKQVSVLVELKARFDEARNIEWAGRLERAGAQVIYGLAGLKVHAKALLIVRREPDRIRRYVHLATGNYNEVTARLYTDIGLLTCDDDFGDDVAAFFNVVTGYSQPAAWRKIVIAPLGLRQRLLHLIDREIERAQAGRKSLIMIKLNSLSDPELIEALYKASRAGVRVRLNVRGICCLRPGVAGLSENIEVVSIVDRFLEHSRILYFRNGGEEEVYLSSADWMPRNIDRRVEILLSVEAAPLKARLIEALEVFLADNVKGRLLQADGRYVRRPPGRRKVRAQEFFMRQAERAAQKAQAAAPREFRPLKPPKSASAGG